MCKTLCCRACSICFILCVNIVVLVLNIFLILVLVWADHKWDFSKYMEWVGMEDASIVFNIMYAVFGSIAAIALLGLIACCCSKKCLMCVYAFLCIIFLSVLIAATLAWTGVFIWILTTLHDKMMDRFYMYNGETGVNVPSIFYNVIFVAFKSCGVDGPGDFVNYHVPTSTIPGYTNYQWPLTCCKDLIKQISPDQIENDFDEKDWDKLIKNEEPYFKQCSKSSNVNEKGSYDVLKKFLIILFALVLAFLLVLVLFLTLLVVAACSVRKNGPKEDKWSKNYNGSDVKKSKK